MGKLVLYNGVSEEQIIIVAQIEIAWIERLFLYKQLKIYGRAYILLCIF